MESKSKSKRHTRRWFVSATGWGLSLSLGSGANQPVGKLQKREIDVTPDSKYLSYNYSSNVTYGTLLWFNALAGISAGTGTGNRIGERIFVENLSNRLIFSNSGATTANSGVTFRVLLVASTYKYSSATLTSGSFTSANVFMSPIPTDQAIAITDPRECKVLCDEVVSIKPSISGQVEQEYLHMACDFNSWYEYETATSNGEVANLYWVIIGDSIYGTPGTTVAGNVIGQSTVLFRDK